MSLRKVGEVYYMDFIVHGKRIYKSTGKKSKPEALRVQELTREQVLKEMTMSQAERDAEACQKLYFSKAAQKTYDEKWKYNEDDAGSLSKSKLILNYIPDKSLRDYVGADIMTLKNKMKAAGKSDGTINRYLACFKTVFNWCDVRPPKIEMFQESKKGRIRYLSDDEEKILLKTLKDMGEEDIHNLVVLLLDTGMRLGEALELTHRMFDFKIMKIRLEEREKQGNPTLIPMTDRIKDIMNSQRWLNPFGKVFPNLNVDRVETVWQKVRIKMKLQEDKAFVPHALRHTFASRLVQKGVPLYVVKELLGHSNITVTEKYSHLTNKEHEDAIDILQGKKTDTTKASQTDSEAGNA